jgi:putative ABC transport system ATP-binding protein
MTVLVRASGVGKMYGVGASATEALQSVSITLRPGELTLLMGPSGSGKTTLVSILAGVTRPSYGSVDLCGTSLTDQPERVIARVRRTGVGFVFQSYNLFPALSALDNVATPLRMRGVCAREARARAKAGLILVGLEDRLGHLPRELSGGQKQRVAIARSLVGAPSLLVGDEVTAALDSESTQVVMRLLRAFVTATTGAVLVTHDRRLEPYADRLVHMESGRIVDDRATPRSSPEIA